MSALEVIEVTRPVPLVPGTVYIGRGDADLIVGVRQAGLVAMSAPASSEHRWHPSVDRLVASAMQHIGAKRLVGMLMTGMGHDGAATMTELRRGGGVTIAEAEETAVVWGMPGELVRAGGASHVAPLTRSPHACSIWSPQDDRVATAGPPALSASDLQRFCDFLYMRTGMQFDETKRYYVDRRINERLAANGRISFASYFSLLRFSPAETEELINSFTINETYFYREHHQFRLPHRNSCPK